MSWYIGKLPKGAYYKSVDLKKYKHIMDSLNSGKLIGKDIRVTNSYQNGNDEETYFDDIITSCKSVYFSSKSVSIPHVGKFDKYFNTYKLTLLRGDNEYKYIYLHVVDYTSYPKHEFYIYSILSKEGDQTIYDYMRANTKVNFHELFDIKKHNRSCRNKK